MTLHLTPLDGHSLADGSRNHQYRVIGVRKLVKNAQIESSEYPTLRIPRLFGETFP